jgi:hypothetical protein
VLAVVIITQKMSKIAKEIILDELIENSHIERVEDVIYWALEDYYKTKKSNGSLVAYAIIQRIKEGELNSESGVLNVNSVLQAFS